MSPIKPTADEIRIVATGTDRVAARVNFPRAEAYISQVSFAREHEPTLAEILHEFDWEAQRRPNKPNPAETEVSAS